VAAELSARPAPASEIAVRVRGITHRWGQGQTPALTEVDAQLRRGQLTVLAGANGAGKTTLLRIFAGTLVPTAGEVQVLGHEVRREGRPRALRSRVSYLSQDLALDPEMTGRETLELLAAFHGLGRGAARHRATELAQAFGIGAQLDRPVGKWSGGERRRLHLASALVQGPELLLLDEPTAGLDAEGRDFLWAELRLRARAGITIAMVTHDLAAAEEGADAVLILDRGRRLAAGSPGELLATHGRTRVEITLAGEAPEERAVEAWAERLGGITVHGRKGSQLVLELPPAGAASRQVLAALAAAPWEIRGIRTRPPSLAGVFRHLTGQEPAPGPERRGRGGRRRHER